MNIFRVVLYFTVFSFVGWVSETLITSILEKKFMKRGFLTGPFIPVYGFGGLIVVLLLSPLKPHPVLLYFTGVLSVTVLEYFTGWLMESLFSIKLWDYSQYKLQIKGRVWLVSSLFFGVLGLLGTYVVAPPLERFVEGLKPNIVRNLGIIFFIYFVIDATNSVVAAFGLKEKLHALGSLLSQKELVSHDEYVMTREERPNWFQKRLLHSYPHAKSKKYPYALKKIKEYFSRKDTSDSDTVKTVKKK